MAASRKLADRGFDTADARRWLDSYRRLFPLVHPTDHALDQPIDLYVNHQWSWWDALLVAACLEAGVNRLYSEDLPGQRLASLEIVNPFA